MAKKLLAIILISGFFLKCQSNISKEITTTNKYDSSKTAFTYVTKEISRWLIGFGGEVMRLDDIKCISVVVPVVFNNHSSKTALTYVTKEISRWLIAFGGEMRRLDDIKCISVVVPVVFNNHSSKTAFT